MFLDNKEGGITMKCPHCNSENIEEGLRMFEYSNGSPVGFRFSKGLAGMVVAQIHCDICKDCMTIVRSYIVEDTDKKWLK